MILRICVCIPTFNNPKTIVSVVQDVLKNCDLPLLVIDDGSQVPVTQLLEDAKLLRGSRVQVLRFELNCGKGAALQRAFQEAGRLGYTHLLSIDGDSQHFAHEIPKLVEQAKKTPWNLIIGSRQLGGTHVPEISRFGRNFSNFWVKFQTTLQVKDSQSGFRLYPLFQVQNLSFYTRRFDFEIEILIRLLWLGVGISEVEVDCHYPPPDERVSHFDKLWDNARISALNAVLVVLSLLRMKSPPWQVGLAVGTGVLIGCTPFYGLHTLIAVAASFLFRLNFPYLVLGTQISLPPFIPFLILGSVKIGKKVFGVMALHGTKAVALDWLVGSFILGIGLGVILGLIAYLTALTLRRKNNKTPSQWSGETRGGRSGNAFMKLVIGRLGLGAAYFCLYFVVPYFYLFAPKARRACSEYWRTTQPELKPAARQLKIFKQLMVFAKTLVDRVYQSHHDEIKFQTHSTGKEALLEVFQKSEGIILMGAHVGAWELGALAFKQYNLSTRFAVLRFEAEGITFHKVTGADKKLAGKVATVYSNQQASPLLKVRELLNTGSPVGMMADRPRDGHFELVKFFGKLVPVDVTPFRVAVSCQTKLAFSFGFKGSRQDYYFYASEPKTYRYSLTHHRSLQCLEWAQEFAQVLESQLKKYPEQWFNFFPYWSSRPAVAVNSDSVEAKEKERHYLREELNTQKL